mmetsp:Transcript_81366/g.174165  ORF Transcript_81366/g.174165 Transcript_81366/m.174165 type:complete len:217 (-) Transcript_81366:925-1575(-)
MHHRVYGIDRHRQEPCRKAWLRNRGWPGDVCFGHLELGGFRPLVLPRDWKLFEVCGEQRHGGAFAVRGRHNSVGDALHAALPDAPFLSHTPVCFGGDRDELHHPARGLWGGHVALADQEARLSPLGRRLYRHALPRRAHGHCCGGVCVLDDRDLRVRPPTDYDPLAHTGHDDLPKCEAGKQRRLHPECVHLPHWLLDVLRERILRQGHASHLHSGP